MAGGDGDRQPREQERPGVIEWALILILVAILVTTALLLLGDRVDRVIPGFSNWVANL